MPIEPIFGKALSIIDIKAVIHTCTYSYMYINIKDLFDIIIVSDLSFLRNGTFLQDLSQLNSVVQ